MKRNLLFTTALLLMISFPVAAAQGKDEVTSDNKSLQNFFDQDTPIPMADIPFTRERWLTEPALRLNMCQDLVKTKSLLGKNRQDVEKGLIKGLGVLDEQTIVYPLQRSPGGCGNTPIYRLEVVYDRQNDTVIRYRFAYLPDATTESAKRVTGWVH